MDRLAFLWKGARYQDNLLQAYRNFHFIMQTILLGIGAGLSVATISFQDSLRSWCIYCLLLIITSFGIYLLRVMRKLIKARSDDVNYYHREIIAAEKDLPGKDQVLTSFKLYQKSGKGEKNFTASEITASHRSQLIEKEKGHTRQILDMYVSRYFFLVWISFHIIVLGAFLIEKYT